MVVDDDDFVDDRRSMVDDRNNMREVLMSKYSVVNLASVFVTTTSRMITLNAGFQRWNCAYSTVHSFAALYPVHSAAGGTVRVSDVELVEVQSQSLPRTTALLQCTHASGTLPGTVMYSVLYSIYIASTNFSTYHVCHCAIRHYRLLKI